MNKIEKKIPCMKTFSNVKQMYCQKSSNVGTPVREVPLFFVSCKEIVDYIGFYQMWTGLWSDIIA